LFTEPVGLPQGARGDVVQVGEPQEQHAEVAHLRQPGGLAGVQAGQDRPGHIASKGRPGRLAGGAHQRRRRWERLDHGDAQAWQPPGTGGHRLPGTQLAHLVDRLRGQHDVPRPPELFGVAGLCHRWAADHELPPATDTTEVGGRHLPNADPDPHRQARPGRELAGVQDPLHGQPTARGSSRHPGQTVIGRPQRKQRITGELHHIAAVIHDQLDQSAKATVQQLGQLLDTSRPGPR
jgi:hypothetical protein